MKRLIYLSLVMLVINFVACKKEVDHGQLAAIAAKGYYDLLLEEKYEDYVNGFYRPESIPQSYHEQLVANAKMFVARQQDARKGIKEVTVANAKADTATHTANVFLQFVYGDSTSEQVLVPMVEHEGKWLMR